jgi:hypothetical protein
MEAKDAWLPSAGTLPGKLLAAFAASSVGGAFRKLKSGFIKRNKARMLDQVTCPARSIFVAA